MKRIIFPTFLAIFFISPVSLGLSQTQTFTSTFANQSYTVPLGVTSLLVELWGGGGGGNGIAGNGGAGAFVSGTLSVTPGSTLTVIVGSGGGFMGGFGGGGVPRDSFAGGGGGRSAITLGGVELIDAGGGGGGFFNINNFSISYQGGAAGISFGSAGVGPQRGLGGTQTAGGAGFNSGSFLQGGNAPNGAGGGGGYYGGGGSFDGSGGGGSSYGSAFISSFGGIAGSGSTAPNQSDLYYLAGVAQGGINTDGGSGLVVITAVPEPSTLALAVLGLPTLLAYRRKARV